MDKPQFNESNSFSVDLPNGQKASMLVPNYNKDQILAIVDAEVLNTLISFLPSAAFNQIKQSFIDRVEYSKNLEDMAKTIKKELNFHESVNIMKEYFKFDKE